MCRCGMNRRRRVGVWRVEMAVAVVVYIKLGTGSDDLNFSIDKSGKSMGQARVWILGVLAG